LPAGSKLALLGLLLTTGGCSLDGFQFQACTSHAQCRESLGFGATCGNDGLCTQAHPTARCASTYPEDLFTAPTRHRQTHVLASLMDRSSDAHVTREKAIRLAIKGANDAGGLEGHQFGLIMCDIRADPMLDDQTRTAAAVGSANFVARTLGVPAIIGPSASTDTEQVWQAVQDAGTLVISPAATSPALSALETNTSDEHPGLLWRVAPTDSLQGRVIAEDMIDRKVTKALVIRETGSYGEGLASVFANRFRQDGGSITLVSISSEAQARAAAAGLDPADPAEVLFVSSQQAWIVGFLTAAGGESAYTQRGIFLTDAAANQAVLTSAASAANLYPHVRGTRPAPRDPSEYLLGSFIADYKQEYAGALPTTATFSAHAFDAAWLAVYGVAYGVLREHHISGEAIGRGLRRMSSGAEVPILQASWPQVLAAFRAGNSINVRGASGELDFDPVNRELAAPIEIWTIGSVAGQFTMVKLDTRTPSVQ
jgi:ABC-type branched-subunit amino acid transport system substrate-binding protein